MRGAEVHADVWHVRPPLRRPLKTTLGVIPGFSCLLVRLRDRDGNTGAGISMNPPFGNGDDDGRAALAVELLEQCSGRLGPLLTVERARGSATRDTSPVLIQAAANAISLAAWDLLGRREGIACADLWGRQAETESLPCYFSGLFMDLSLEELTEEAESHRDNHYRLVKMRASTSLEVDLERVQTVQDVFPKPRTVAVDAHWQWDGARTAGFLRRVSTPLLWLEDPVPYDRLDELAGAVGPIAAGETCTRPAALRALHEAGSIPNLLPDVQQLGGPVRFLETARGLGWLGARVGAHQFHQYAAHLLACVPDPLPVEATDWWDALFLEQVVPGADGRMPVRGPGFGVSLNEETLQRHGRLLATVPPEMGTQAAG
jgi:L-alanine-DL-glutamate epimerase-like enolase superfamily enzyme